MSSQKCLRLFSENYADSESYANLLKSSEQANFPATNLLSKIRRSKVWRSNGYFKIESGSNTITFRDSASTDLVATIAAGEYSTTALFMAAVDSAFESAGAANYTITQNSSLKFVITSDISGGATAFKIIWSASAAMAGIMGFDVADLSGAISYTSDYLKIHTDEFVTFDLGLPSLINAFTLTGPRNRAIKLSTTATLKLQGNYTNSWTSPAYDSTLTYNDEIIYAMSETDFSLGTPLRYWRLQLVDQNPNGYIEIGSIFLGTWYAPTRGAAQFPLKSALDDRSTTIYSEGGQSFSDVLEKTQNYSADWVGLNKDELDEILKIFANFGTSYPIFIMFDSQAAFSPSINRFLKLVKFKDSPQFELRSPNNFSMSMSFREEI